MKLIDCIHVCLINFLIYYFDIINLLKTDKDSLYFDSIMNPTHYESISATWVNDSEYYKGDKGPGLCMDVSQRCSHAH